MSAYLSLAIAIVAEVIATTALKSSQGFTRLLPGLIVVVGYGVSFYCLALTLRTIPTSVAYAIWSGVGLVLITLAAWLILDQVLTVVQLLGAVVLLAGAAIVQVAAGRRIEPDTPPTL